MLDDRSFDDQLPARLQVKSSTHFTPVLVAQRAARLLAPRSGMRVLDIGSGVGKFCIAAAQEVATATFVGVEWRPHLVEVAIRSARRHALANVQFVSANVFDVDWAAYDAFYFFNPFAEQLVDRGTALDGTIAFDPDTYVRQIIGALERLTAARLGTRVVTYHGLGVELPSGYELTSEDRIGNDRLSLWVKESQS